ncbi:MAG: DUF4126 domain-containing protein [Acidobacteriota bacterium]
MMESTLLSLAAGMGLAAACGFRVFIPLLVMSLAARGGHLELAETFTWIESTPALLAFGAATTLEVLGYYVPWIDNLLDTMATPSAVVAGTVAMGSQTLAFDPWLGWTLAAIGGGGAAGAVQGVTVVTRSLSSFATGGLGNPLVSTLEGAAAIGLTLLAVIMPLIAVFVLLVVMTLLLRMILRRRGRGGGTDDGALAATAG